MWNIGILRQLGFSYWLQAWLWRYGMVPNQMKMKWQKYLKTSSFSDALLQNKFIFTRFINWLNHFQWQLNQFFQPYSNSLEDWAMQRRVSIAFPWIEGFVLKRLRWLEWKFKEWGQFSPSHNFTLENLRNQQRGLNSFQRKHHLIELLTKKLIVINQIKYLDLHLCLATLDCVVNLFQVAPW